MPSGRIRRLCAALSAGVAAGFVAGLAAAHNGVVHKTPQEAAAHRAEIDAQPAAAAPTPDLPFPVDVTARFDLVTHHGEAVTEADFAGRPMAVFFGYASCEAICSVAMPRLGEALDALGEDWLAETGLAPLVITVDPAHDTPQAMREGLARWHPRLLGLTGSEAALADTRKAFQVEARQISEDIDGQPIYAHGSFIYLVGREGKVATLLPPILSSERMAEIIRGYF